MRSFVHDAAFHWAGAERVFEQIVAARPAPASTVFVAGDKRLIENRLSATSNKVLHPHIRSQRQFRMSVPLLAHALPRMDSTPPMTTYSSYAVARWLPSEGPRLVYTHAPMRQIWHGLNLYKQGLTPTSVALRLLHRHVRAVDERASRRDDYVVCPSQRVARLVESIYGCDVAAIVPPPVDATALSTPLAAKGEYLVWVGRITEPIKRVALLLAVMERRPRRRLIVVGDGPDRARLQRTAPPNVIFTGWLDGPDKYSVVSGAQALLIPSMEDFGLAGAEALSLGTPVVATPETGLSDWLEPGRTGYIVQPVIAQLLSAIDQLDALDQGEDLRRHALRFAPSAFREGILSGWRELGWLTPPY